MADSPIVSGPAVRTKTGSGRLGVRKNGNKRANRQSAALEAAARKRIESREAAERKREESERMRVLMLAKLSTCGWDGDAQLDENGGVEVARVPGAYTVALHYDPLRVTAKTNIYQTRVSHSFDVITTIEKDVGFIYSHFEIPDEDFPAPSLLGPWALRVRYDEETLRGQFPMIERHLESFDLGVPPAARDADADGGGIGNDSTRFCFVFTDDNAEELVGQIRFTAEQEAALNELLRDMCATGRMRAVDAFLLSNGLRV
jgi:hypothetical protein